jgi:hypothetical protein
MAVILVLPVNAIGSYFILLTVFYKGNCAMLDARFQNSLTQKNSLRLLREGGGGYIKIVWLDTANEVANGAANYIGAITRTLKRVQNPYYVFWQEKVAHHGILSLFSYTFSQFFDFTCNFSTYMLQYIKTYGRIRICGKAPLPRICA